MAPELSSSRKALSMLAAVAEPTPMSIERMREYPILANLSDGVLKRLQPNLSERSYASGQLILRAGDYGDTVYYIAEGVVEVRLVRAGSQAGTKTAAPEAAGSGGIGRWLGRLAGAAAPVTPAPAETKSETVVLADMPVDMRIDQRVLLDSGEIFGEMSALTRYPISADVTAASASRCLLIRAPALRLMLKQKELAGFKKDLDERYRNRTLVAHLRGVELLASVSDEDLAVLRDSAELLSFEPGSIIVEQGTPADAFYLVRGGYVKVGLRAGTGQIAVTYLRKGDFTGEIPLLLNEPWPYTLSALEHVELVRIDKSHFEQLLGKYRHVQTRLWDNTVRQLKQRGLASRNPLSSQYLQMAMDTGLIHGESVLLIDLTTCTRCDDCVQACADTHGGTPRFIREGVRLKNFSVPTACYQCSDPVCMIGCPTGAITRPIGTLEVTINKETCIGCQNCVNRCPWGNITPVPFDSPTLGRPIDLATKCDLCIGRPQGPACVQMCPHGAATRINFKDLDRVASTFSRS